LAHVDASRELRLWSSSSGCVEQTALAYPQAPRHHERAAGELAGTTDVATMLNVSRQRVGQLVDRYEDFPAPVDLIAGPRVWSRMNVESWTAKHR
jgi:hypothetical protein